MWFERRDSKPLAIGPVRAERAGAARRIAADVAGTPVWIESSDTDLRPAPEVFASAFLLPAMHHGRQLELSDPVDPLWLDNVAKLQQIFHQWWGYPARAPRAMSAPAPNGEAPGGAGALFFSGGVDSFHSLLHASGFDRLVSIHGFDIPLEDEARMAAATAITRAVAAERGLRAIGVRTNLRTHPLLAPLSWERVHGGVLAAIGHALGDGVPEVLISSSIAKDRFHAWGSHWQCDHLHSSTTRRFRQVGMELRRVDKLREIAAEPLVQKHLRVCWKNLGASLNCQRCQKCLQSRLVLAECGVLDRCATLEGTATLARDLDQIDRYRDHLRAITELARSPRLEPPIRSATERLLRRSLHATRPWVRARRAVLRQVNVWMEGARS